MKNPFRNWFKKTPHICEYKCVSYCEHYGTSNIEESLKNPSWYHYPYPSVQIEWLKKGYDQAFVFQSHWNCSCGKRQTFFFLANPSIQSNSNGRFTNADVTISTVEYNQMKNCNPFVLGSSRGTSMNEMVKELTNEFCPTK